MIKKNLFSRYCRCVEKSGSEVDRVSGGSVKMQVAQLREPQNQSPSNEKAIIRNGTQKGS
jgi:hypothetical protein